MSFKLHLIIDKNNTNKPEAIGNALLKKQYDFIEIPRHELSDNEDIIVLELDQPGIAVDVIVSDIIKDEQQIPHAVNSGNITLSGNGMTLIPQLDENGVDMQYKVREGILTMVT